MENTKMTFEQFKAKRVEFLKTQPNYLQGLEDDFELSTKNMYNNYYLKGRVAKWAK